MMIIIIIIIITITVVAFVVIFTTVFELSVKVCVIGHDNNGVDSDRFVESSEFMLCISCGSM